MSPGYVRLDDNMTGPIIKVKARSAMLFITAEFPGIDDKAHYPTPLWMADDGTSIAPLIAVTIPAAPGGTATVVFPFYIETVDLEGGHVWPVQQGRGAQT